jgi:serine/threonine protein kinase
LDKNQHIRICDFGFGKVCDDQQLLTTYCGSPFYAAPEMVTATPYTGPKVDIWSCGVILFAMISGKLPFQCENMPDLFKKISIGAYNVPHSIKASPAALIARMLCVKPADRASAQDILDHAWLSGSYTDTTPVPNPAMLRLPPTLAHSGTEENEPLTRDAKPDIIKKTSDAKPASVNRVALQIVNSEQVNTENGAQPTADASKEILSKDNQAAKAKRKWFLSGKRMQVAPLKTNIIIGSEATKKIKEADIKLFDKLRVFFKNPKKTLTAV